jgi:inhibitor of KinA
MSPDLPYKIFALGDSAITLDFGNVIDEEINKKVIALFQYFSQSPFPGMIEAVPTYSSLTMYYDVFSLQKMVDKQKTIYEWVKEKVEIKMLETIPDNEQAGTLIKIPVCYDPEFGMDIEELAAQKNISIGDVILLHSEKKYRVFMLGFLPGFAYLGIIDERIAMPRKSHPRRKVEPGSVGIAGSQTGIYPLQTPGGWQIIGRTPMKLFDMENEQPTLLQAGDLVEFIPISKKDFLDLQ